MSGEVLPNPEKESVEFITGCNPQVHFEVIQDNGNLFIKVTSLDGADLDAVFFNFTDPDVVGNVGTWCPDGSSIEMVDDGVNSLSDGTELMGDYDARIEFGSGDSGVEGDTQSTCFTLWGNNGPLSLEDLDIESFAVVVDTESDEGTVLTHNDGADPEHEMNDFVYGDWHPDGNGGWVYVGDEDEEAPASDARIFTIEGDSNIQVRLTELDNGDMQVDLEVLDNGEIADLRGLFFNLTDGDMVDGLSVSGSDVTDFKFEEGDVDNLGGGVNIRGDVRNEVGKMDAGVEIGTSGIGSDDIQSTSFVLSHSDGALTYADFEGSPFAVRLTSVGDDREDSLKLLGYANWEAVEDECPDQYALGEEASGDQSDEKSISFVVDGLVDVQVTMTELDDGDMKVDLEVLETDGNTGDLRGMFFGMNDDSLADDLSVSGDDVSDDKFDDDKVDNLGGGVKIPKDIKDFFGKFDGGVEIGSKDIDGDDDVQSTTFILSHDEQPLTIEDFQGQPIVLHVDSIGPVNGDEDDREDEAFLLGAITEDEFGLLGDPDSSPDADDDDDEDEDDGGWDFSFWLF